MFDFSRMRNEKLLPNQAVINLLDAYIEYTSTIPQFDGTVKPIVQDTTLRDYILLPFRDIPDNYYPVQ